MKCPEIIKEALFGLTLTTPLFIRKRKRIFKDNVKKKKTKIKTLEKSDKIRNALINMSKDYTKYHGDLYFD